jgi:hypothetical protein
MVETLLLGMVELWETPCKASAAPRAWAITLVAAAEEAHMEVVGYKVGRLLAVPEVEMEQSGTGRIQVEMDTLVVVVVVAGPLYLEQDHTVEMEVTVW